MAQVNPDACNFPDVIWADADKLPISKSKQV
jgi:hypothetical protein